MDICGPDRDSFLPSETTFYKRLAEDAEYAAEYARATRAGLYHVTLETGEAFTIEAKGRDAWALDRLREAGPRGCTPIAEPGPRWSAYVHNLRGRGVPIETVYEPHGGEFSGHHGRYVLRADVREGGAE